MCVIIDKDPGKSIPADMLDLACDINKDGFGVSWIDKEVIVTERDTKKNDPKEISDLLQRHQSQRLFIHLRHATKGQVIAENSHPFIGMDNTLGFMHNGTLYEWTPADEKYSDSKCFFEHMLRPMAAMARKFSGPDWIIKNNIFRRVITDYCKGASVFVIYDNLGNSFRVNEKNGKEYEGFWASNEYSFKKSHYRSSWGAANNTPFASTHSTGQRGTLWTVGQLDLPGVPVSFTEGNHIGSAVDFFEKAHAAAASKPGMSSRVTDKAWEIEGVKGWLTAQGKPKLTEVSVMHAAKVLDAPRRAFQEESGYSIDEVMTKFSERDLEQMAENFPKATAAMIVDMFVQNRMHQAAIARHVSVRGDEEVFVA